MRPRYHLFHPESNSYSLNLGGVGSEDRFRLHAMRLLFEHIIGQPDYQSGGSREPYRKGYRPLLLVKMQVWDGLVPWRSGEDGFPFPDRA